MRVLFLILAGTSLLALMAVASYRLGFAEGRAEGTKAGMRDALKTNPVSHELEMTCLGLWVGEQHKKYQQKGN